MATSAFPGSKAAAVFKSACVGPAERPSAACGHPHSLGRAQRTLERIVRAAQMSSRRRTSPERLGVPWLEAEDLGAVGLDLGIPVGDNTLR